MGTVNISFTLPDGEEQALITEFATFHGWIGEGTAAAHAKKVLAEVIRESIKHSREQQAQEVARVAVITPEIK
jgi:uncharacterized membrane protein required for colicin V production